MTTPEAAVGNVNRRRFLRTSALTIAAASAVPLISVPAAAQEDLESWFADVDNYDGVADMTGKSEVRIEVGANANGGAFGFGPAAVRVSPGTTVVWEWVEGYHDVTAVDGTFQSEMAGDVGYEFTHQLDQPGTYKYVCTPHEAMGMKGAIIVGDGAAAGDAGASIAPTGEGNKEYLLIGALAGAILTILGYIPVSDVKRRQKENAQKRSNL